MQTEDAPDKNWSQKEPDLSLYTEDEIEGISTTSCFTKSDTLATGQVSEVSSTSQDNCQLTSTTSSKSIFLDLHEEDIVDSESVNVKDVKNNMDGKKPKPGLLLLGEYADSGNDTEEEALNSLRAKRKKTIENLTDKDAGTECLTSEAVNDQNESSKKSIESDIVDVSSEVLSTVKASSPVEEKIEDDKGFDVHTLLDNSLAKFERSVSKEEGQISAESDSSDSERSSESRKDSKKQKDMKKDKSKKKDKKKKKKKRKKQKQKYSGEKKELDITGEEKKERKPIRSRSRESLEKRKSIKQSRSRSRDRVSRHHRRNRSRSQDKVKHSRHLKDRSRRSRSRSISRRRSAINRNLKTRSKSPKRSVSPFMRVRERRDRRSSTSRNRKDSPSSRKRKVSRSRSPRKHRGGSPERRRSRSPRRRSRSPGKRRKKSPERSPSQRSPSRKVRSPNKKERKGSHSPPRKSSHRTSSPSDSLDSGHFTTIPLSKANKPGEFVLDNNKPVQKSSATDEKEKESSMPPKSTDLEKQYSPSFSPEKPWEDEFDFVFTERMSPKQGTEKSMEDVLFGSEAKTPDFKRPMSEESKKSKPKESQHAAKKEETKTEKATETPGIVVTENITNIVPQKMENQDVSSSLQPGSATSKSAIKVDEQSISDSKDPKLDLSAKMDIKDKTDHVEKIDSDTNSQQCSKNSEKSAFMQSKLETIPFLDEAPTVPPPVGGDKINNATSTSQLGHLSPPPASTGLRPMPTLQGQTWRNLSEVGLLPGAVQKLNSNKNELEREKKDNIESFLARNDGGRNNFNMSPLDMEMSSPEGDIIDRMNEEFWKQQQHQSDVNKTESVANEQTSFEEPYEPESGLIIGEEYEEDLNNITDPKERRRREKQQQKEKTKVQELIDKLHRQARVEEEVKHVLKVYYKHRDINKEEYKSILRRAVPQVTNSSSAIDPERIRSLVKKYVAKIKGQRVHSLE